MNQVQSRTADQKSLNVVSIRLVKDAPIMSRHEIHSPMDAIEVLGEYLCDMDREVFCVINLKTDGTPINCSICSVGALDSAIVHPREALKSAILSNAANIIMIHNHPSGVLNPSKQDAMITDRMIQACNLLGIGLLDHVIVGGDNKAYFSFREKNEVPIDFSSYKADYRDITFPDINETLVAEDKTENDAFRISRKHR